MVVYVNEDRTRKVELDGAGAWLADRRHQGEMWSAPELLSLEPTPELSAPAPSGRNRFVLAFEVELTRPVPGDSARAAADLLATDVRRFLRDEGWGWGAARVEAVYAPAAQFAHGDYVPADEAPDA